MRDTSVMMTLAKVPDAAFGKIKSCFCVVDIAVDAGVEYVSKQINQQCSFFGFFAYDAAYSLTVK